MSQKVFFFLALCELFHCSQSYADIEHYVPRLVPPRPMSPVIGVPAAAGPAIMIPPGMPRLPDKVIEPELLPPPREIKEPSDDETNELFSPDLSADSSCLQSETRLNIAISLLQLAEDNHQALLSMVAERPNNLIQSMSEAATISNFNAQSIDNEINLQLENSSNELNRAGALVTQLELEIRTCSANSNATR